MDKLLEVKEFDAIISNSDYKDDSKYRYLDKKRFDNLVSFIHAYTFHTTSNEILANIN